MQLPPEDVELTEPLPYEALDAKRRERLLRHTAHALACSALLFAALGTFLQGYPHPTALVLAAGGALALALPALLRRTGSTLLPGTLLCLEFLVLTGLVVLNGNGFAGAALLWAPAVPLLASFVVGPRVGAAMALLVVAELGLIFTLDVGGYGFPEAYDPEKQGWLHLVGLVGLTGILLLFGWLYESQTIEKLRRMNRQLRDAHETLRRSEARFRWLVRHNADLMTIVAEDGAVRYQSPSSLPTLGYPPEAMVGTDLFAYLHPEDADAAARHGRELTAGDRAPTPHVYRMCAADGQWRWIESLVTDGRAVPGVEGIVINARDVTEHIRHERELTEAKERAEEMVRLKDAFLANMSHEIRTPLTSVLGFAEWLAEEVPPELVEPVELIGRSGRRLMDTLNSVLDLSRLEAGAMEMAPEPLDLAEEIREAAALLRPQAEARGLDLLVEVPAGPVPALLDHGFVTRILNNLVGNAIKFTERGRVTVTLAEEEETFALRVADTGAGIGPDFLPHLFTAFKQESEGLGRSHEGSGLGLAITRQLVERLGGAIAVESAPGHGSVFTVTLPATAEATVAA